MSGFGASSSSNPFAKSASSNPFAKSATTASTNPFGAKPAASNPFGAKTGAAASNPFAKTATASNPFAKSGTATATSNPFGKPAATTGFGSTASNPFGAKTATASNPFGAKTATTNPFGKPAGTGFGATSGTSSMGLFGNKSAFGTTPAAGGGAFASQGQTVDPALYQLWQHFEMYRKSYMVAGDERQQCKFKALLYNNVTPKVREWYTKELEERKGAQIPYLAQGLIPEKQWRKAEERNPDPTGLVPHPVVGFEELYQRRLKQDETCRGHVTDLQELSRSVDVLERQSHVTKSKLEIAKKQHAQLKHAFMDLARRLEVVGARRVPLQDQERHLGNTLREMRQAIDMPDRFRAKLCEIAAMEKMRADGQIQQQQPCFTEADKRQLFEVLKGMKDGLKELTSVVKTNARDTEIMAKSTFR